MRLSVPEQPTVSPTIQVLTAARSLARGEFLTPLHVDAPEQAVVQVMTELLKRGYALGAIQGADSSGKEASARLFALTSKGEKLLEKFTDFANGVALQEQPRCT